MAKRRTRKQKETARRHFTLYLTPTSTEVKNTQFEPVVKGQFARLAKTPKSQKAKKEKAEFKAEPGNLASIKRDIGRSVMLASLTLALEIVLYLALR